MKWTRSDGGSRTGTLYKFVVRRSMRLPHSLLLIRQSDREQLYKLSPNELDAIVAYLKELGLWAHIEAMGDGCWPTGGHHSRYHLYVHRLVNSYLGHPAIACTLKVKTWALLELEKQALLDFDGIEKLEHRGTSCSMEVVACAQNCKKIRDQGGHLDLLIGDGD